MEAEGNHRRSLGQQGEELACELLLGMGHQILERNWRSGHLEVDIISLDCCGIHFVEVKTRKMSIQTPPQENVGQTKQMRIVRAAKAFMRTKRGLPYGSHECHFDVVGVTAEEGQWRLEWFPQAYIPMYL